MPTDDAERAKALERLQPLVGAWTEQVAVPVGPLGRMSLEWALGARFLLQRSETFHPDFPDSVAIIAADPGGDGYLQH